MLLFQHTHTHVAAGAAINAPLFELACMVRPLASERRMQSHYLGCKCSTTLACMLNMFVYLAVAGNREALAADLRGLLIRPFVPVDTWGKFAVQLSIDGHGTTGRLPVQYLQGTSVTLKMKSPFQDW